MHNLWLLQGRGPIVEASIVPNELSSLLHTHAHTHTYIYTYKTIIVQNNLKRNKDKTCRQEKYALK